MFRRKYWKYITFTIPIKREVTRIGKNEAEITKHIYLTYYNLLIAQGLWQVYYEIVSIIIEKAKRTVFWYIKFSNYDNNKFYFIIAKRCLSLGIYGLLEKFNEISLPEKEDFFQSLKYGRYYWYRLRARKKSLKRFWNKKFRKM